MPMTLQSNQKSVSSLCGCEERAVSEIMAETGHNNKDFSSYHERLLQKGVVISKRRGFLSLALPRFDAFIAPQ